MHFSSSVFLLLVSLVFIAEIIENIPGVLCIQASKSSSLGGQQVLDCDLHFPNNQPVAYIVEWKKDGLNKPVFLQHEGYKPNIHEQFHDRVRLVNDISLEISHIQELDEGWYECKVIYLDGIDNESKNSNGTWIYLNVHIPPKIVSSSPTSFHQPLGTTVKIYCKAEGSPKPNVTWTKDGRSLITSQRISYQKEGSEIIIYNLQEDDGGIFKCTYRNPVGLITQTIHLIVEGQAYIIGPPSNKTAVVGQRITFSCEARGYPSNITYRWYKDNHNVNTQSDFGSRITINNNDGSLVIMVVNKEDMGWYVCRPSNGLGLDPEAAAYLNITYQPQVLIEKMPRSLIWALGFSERLDCPVDANPPVTQIIWTKNGLIINFGTSSLVQLANGSLLVEEVTQQDAGNYRCTAVSSYGNGDSEIVQVEVKDPPRFIVRPLPQYIRQLGQNVMMPCAATGTPYPIISWRRAVGTLEMDGRIQAIGGNLSIQALQKSDHGVYECEASNEVRKIVTTTELVIQNTTPHAPYNVSVETHLFSATVRWIPAYSSSPQHYVIWYRSVINNIGSKWQTMMVQPQNTTRFTLYNLEPDTTYEFKVLSRNHLGDGLFSQTVTRKTLGYIEGIATALPTDSSGNTYIPLINRPVGPRPSSPINVSASSREGSIFLRWQPPISTNVKIFSYSIEYTTDEEWSKAGDTNSADETSFIFTSGQPGSTYSFRVYANGLLAYSIPSEVVSYTVPKDNGFGLSSTEIGGIIGGLLFLVVAVTLAVIAVVCSRRRSRKHPPTKYNNVKYLGPADDVDASRREFTPEWSHEPQNGRRHFVTPGDIFMVPESGKLFPAQPPGYYDNTHGKNQYQPGDRYLYDRERGPLSPSKASNFEPVRRDTSYTGKNLSLPRSVRSQRSLQSGAYDPDDDRFLWQDENRSFHPQDQYADSQSPTGVHYNPDLDRSNRGMPYITTTSGARDRSRSPLQSRSPVRSPTSQVRQEPLPPRPPPPPPRPWQEADDDEEVFMPPPVSSVLPTTGRLSLPRHSSMKPGAQTYLTDDDWQDEPFIANDLSSVLPSPSFQSQRPQYQPYQREYENFPFRREPADSSTLLPPHDRSDMSFDNTGNDTVIPRDTSTIRQDSNSSDSSGRPLNYTRDRLQGAVDRVRKGPRTGKRGQGFRGSGSDLDNISESPVQPGFYSRTPFDERPSLKVLDRPSRDSALETGGGGGVPMMDSRGSMSSSGLGSDGRFRYPGLDSRSYDMTPDSVSSGIGSRNTSSQLTGSSLHSRPSRLGSHPTSQELSLDSGHNELPPVRKDISGDENYEFDSVTAAESDLLEALRNYSEVNNGNEDLLSALQDGLNTSGFLQDLYPKPRRQSRYSDSEQRFEKLRGEFQQYRQKQQERRSGGSVRDRSYSSGNGDRSYGSGSVDKSQRSGSLGFQPRHSDSSSHSSSRASYPRGQDSRYGDHSQGTEQFRGYQPRRSDSSYHSSRGSAHQGYDSGPSYYMDDYRQGPMDSEML